MEIPFNPPPGPVGFGFAGPGHPRGHAHREMRNHLREHLRHQAMSGGPFGFGPRGGFGPGFGPGFGFGPGRPGAGRRGHGRGRRGDVRSAILVLLADRPMHGYEMIQEIVERSQGAWKPSPGSVYPTLQLLDDEGLIVSAESVGTKKLFELTEEGRSAAAKIATPPWDEIAEGVDPAEKNLRAAAGQLFGAVAQSAHAVGPEQQQRIIEILNGARREIYQILGESE
jgi:DNA-binding PadR family transcriptional regulator